MGRTRAARRKGGCTGSSGAVLVSLLPDPGAALGALGCRGQGGTVASTSTRGAPFDLSHVLGFHVRHWKDAVVGGNGFCSSGWDLSSNEAT